MVGRRYGVDLSSITLLAMTKEQIRYLSERQTVLSQNIANANTPGYIPKDLKPLDFKALAEESAGGISLATTHPGHMSPTSSASKFKRIEQPDAFEVTPTGNAVVLEEQTLKMSGNSLNYQTATSVYKKMLDMLQTAAGTNR